MNSTYYTVSEMVAKCREFCGCYSCLGGYQPRPRDIAAQPDRPRTPTSCVLNTMVEHYLKNPSECTKPQPEEGADG